MVPAQGAQSNSRNPFDCIRFTVKHTVNDEVHGEITVTPLSATSLVGQAFEPASRFASRPLSTARPALSTPRVRLRSGVAVWRSATLPKMPLHDHNPRTRSSGPQARFARDTTSWAGRRGLLELEGFGLLQGPLYNAPHVIASGTLRSTKVHFVAQRQARLAHIADNDGTALERLVRS